MNDIFDLVRRANANGRIIAPESDDPWAAQVRGAAPEALVAIATGSRARAMKAEARVAELEAAAQPEPEPDPKAAFRSKNATILNRLIGRQAPTPNPKD